ncbi:MAG TPA: hypothetical protein VEG25_09130 [Burkholderiales bacterium]|nr:hypothetical protein [Burkholderiales bacterium]
MNHLENLIGEWYEYQGYVVRRNVKVGKLSHGGWEGELDVVAYHPRTHHLLHIEPSIDAYTWTKRQQRFEKKFRAGRKYIKKVVFPWLGPEIHLEQWAVILGSDKTHKLIGGGKVVLVRNLIQQITNDIRAAGAMERNAVPELYPLLRTIQFFVRWGAMTPNSQIERETRKSSARR